MFADPYTTETTWTFQIAMLNGPFGWEWRTYSQSEYQTEEAARIAAERLFFGTKRRIRIVRIDRPVVAEYDVE
jgi:hypothetical protein